MQNLPTRVFLKQSRKQRNVINHSYKKTSNFPTLIPNLFQRLFSNLLEYSCGILDRDPPILEQSSNDAPSGELVASPRCPLRNGGCCVVTQSNLLRDTRTRVHARACVYVGTVTARAKGHDQARFFSPSSRQGRRVSGSCRRKDRTRKRFGPERRGFGAEVSELAATI